MIFGSCIRLDTQATGIMRRPVMAWTLMVSCAFLFLTGCAPTGEQDASTGPVIEYYDPDPTSGTSQAVVVGEAPLAHTTQLFPLNQEGRVVSSSPAKQTRHLLDNLQTALKAGGTESSNLARIHVYATSADVVTQVRRVLADTFPDSTGPAVTYMVGKLPVEGAKVAMDAVAAVRSEGAKRVSRHRTTNLPGDTLRGHTAILPSDNRVYLSGQAARGDNLLEGVHGTMAELLGTLAYLNLDASNVVQVKAFIKPMDQGPKVREAIRSYFRETISPSIITVEWTNDFRPAEIELIAGPGPGREQKTEPSPLQYLAPPWLQQSTGFSRIVRVDGGRLVYTSGLYGSSSRDMTGQAQEIFEKLKTILQATGSSYDQLVKVTYYYSGRPARDGLTSMIPKYYNPDRPPAASLVGARGTGRPQAPMTLDMIARTPD